MNKLYFFLAILVFGCGDSRDKKNDNKISDINNTSLPLFSLRSVDDTGINFKNLLTESRNLNGILYEYLYNGGGVAVADFNSDKFLDVYFVSNLGSNKLYLNKKGLKFIDITEEAQVTGVSLEGNVTVKEGFPTGVTVVDINSDGKIDIYVCKSGKHKPDNRRNELYINLGNNTQGHPVFKEEAKKYGLDLPHFSTQATFFDYDKDGDLDMFLLNHGTKPYQDKEILKLISTKAPLQSSRLFKNDNGFYTDISEQSGIINNAISFGLGIAVGDLNNDTWPDIIVGNDFSEKDYLYLNQKNGTFKEVIKEATNHISYFSMGNDISDLNNDGWLDFMSVDMMSEHNYDIKTSMSGMNPERFYKLTEIGLHSQYMYNTVQLNNGIMNKQDQIPVFSDVAQMNGVANTDWSWSPLLFDMDNDGWKDIFVSNGIKRDFRNNDFINYKKSKFDDFFSSYGVSTPENKQKARDLIIDLIKEMPIRNKANYFYQNQKGAGFSKKNNIWIEDYATSSNGAAYADLDNDGDLDIITNNTDDYAIIYENNSMQLNKGNYIKVKLNGSKNNINAIGARVILEQNKETQTLENYASRGFQSATSGDLHFGVGAETKIEKITVIWPDGKTAVYNNIDANQVITFDYKDSDEKYIEKEALKVMFTDITEITNLKHKHKENDFNDFDRESLLPHKMSQLGPALAVYDLNNDGLDDIYNGGAHGESGKLYFQLKDGTFQEKKETPFYLDKEYEDVSALFFDADGDLDADLYIVSGGNEFDEGAKKLEDRFYENIGNGNFKRVEVLPFMRVSGSIVKAADYDKDGDLDLFVGGRQKPGRYPEPTNSFLLQNNSKDGQIKFSNVTTKVANALHNIGMVTDAVWLDIDQDNWMDLLVVGEWMSPVVLRNNNGIFEDITLNSGLAEQTGWWFSLATGDFDGDGDEDILAGNLGLNYKYKATPKEPFKVYQKDFDKNGTLDIALGYYDLGNLYPLRGRQCSSNQMPGIKKKFENYHAFAQATLTDVYGKENLEEALHYEIKNFASSYFENKGDGTFEVKQMSLRTQTSSINAINVGDFNKDSNLDIIISGNWYVSEVETPRNDASYGMFLAGDGKGNFKEVSAIKSGLYVKGDVRNAKIINMSEKKKALVVAKNNDFVQVYKIND